MAGVASVGWWILVGGCAVVALILVAAIARLVAGARRVNRGVRGTR
jgi:tRNA G37 N-methylase TrmD